MTSPSSVGQSHMGARAKRHAFPRLRGKAGLICDCPTLRGARPSQRTDTFPEDGEGKRRGRGKRRRLEPLDQRHCCGRIADLGAGAEVDEYVALLGPGLRLLGPLVEGGGLLAGLDLVLDW